MNGAQLFMIQGDSSKLMIGLPASVDPSKEKRKQNDNGRQDNLRFNRMFKFSERDYKEFSKWNCEVPMNEKKSWRRF
jgi:hypothetical protein